MIRCAGCSPGILMESGWSEVQASLLFTVVLAIRYEPSEVRGPVLQIWPPDVDVGCGWSSLHTLLLLLLLPPLCPLAAPSCLPPHGQRWVTSTTTISPDLPQCLGGAQLHLAGILAGGKADVPPSTSPKTRLMNIFKMIAYWDMYHLQKKLPPHPPDCSLLLWPPHDMHRRAPSCVSLGFHTLK